MTGPFSIFQVGQESMDLSLEQYQSRCEQRVSLPFSILLVI